MLCSIGFEDVFEMDVLGQALHTSLVCVCVCVFGCMCVCVGVRVTQWVWARHLGVGDSWMVFEGVREGEAW